MFDSSHQRSANANKQFTCEYRFDGMKWGVKVWAATLEEAEMKLRAMAKGKVLGEVKGIIPAGGKCPTLWPRQRPGFNSGLATGLNLPSPGE